MDLSLLQQPVLAAAGMVPVASAQSSRASSLRKSRLAK